MKQNQNDTDRAIRMIFGLIILYISCFVVTQSMQPVFYIIGGYLAISGILGYCPFYDIFQINTGAVVKAKTYVAKKKPAKKSKSRK